MKVEDLFVPTGKCPLDFLAEMGERIQNAWIFVDKSIIENLKNSDGVQCEKGYNCRILTWAATDKYPKTEVMYKQFMGTGWYIIITIDADDIAFKDLYKIKDPDCIVRLKMAE